ncbi:hypothetical protein [Marinoscillum sp. MHG1-6]|uniref:hypothetical protein n=1 Tax=Marinoscillum sp. MHG1-6 TaxID=2959627 RepID=UPI002157276D|nr:hypothetical protein [Marinoscillum sp. MHG1-6]
MMNHIGIFGSNEQLEVSGPIDSIKMSFLGTDPNIDDAISFLDGLAAQETATIVMSDQLWLSKVSWPDQDAYKSDITFAASSAFHYDDEALRYYFWKFYPRGETPYHYLNASFIAGKAGALVAMFKLIKAEYPEEYSWHDLLTRFYVDYLLKATSFDYHVEIDRTQQLVGDASGQLCAYKWPMLSWIQRDLFVRFESKQFEGNEFLRNKPFGVRTVKGGNPTIKKLKTSPSIWIVPSDSKHQASVLDYLKGKKNSKTLRVWLGSFEAYVKSFWLFLFAWVINRGTTSPYRIFRYAANANPEWKRVMALFLGHLQKREGFTFAHFNDGELTFIKKYLSGDHAETWFGRRQQKYNKLLGQRLTEALKLDQPRHYVGVPCGTSHPKLRQLADSLVEGQKNIVPAMSLHHNPRFFPNIINYMKDRECFFIKNEYQDLTIFEKLGVNIKKENQVIVPFKNSYLQYDELKEMEFPDGGIVILICGMLAKIIIPVWFENNPNTTFIALGSSMDDFIQRTNTKFRLFPKEGLPLTCNIQPTKFFAFGWKKECPECWTMEKDFDWPK